MECHRCPHSRDVAGGKFAGVPWEETPCAECFSAGRPGAVCLEAGKRHVPLDVYHVPYDDGKGGGLGGGDLDPADVRVPLSVLGDALRLFLSLPRRTLDVIRLRFSGKTYREIARELGLGRSNCSMLVVRAFDKNPVLLELLPKTKGRRERRLWLKRKCGRGRKASAGSGAGGKLT